MNDEQKRILTKSLSKQMNEFLRMAGELEEENIALKVQVTKLQSKLEEQIVEVMKISARESEARDEARNLRTTVKRYLDQRNHNCCILFEKELYDAIGKEMPNIPRCNVTLAEMFCECEHYVPTLYPDLTEREKRHVERLKAVTREYLHD